MIRAAIRIFGFLVVVVVIAVIGGFSYLYLRKPAVTPPADLKVEITPARLERGKYLFNLADCDGCHSQRDFSRFGGPVVEDGRGRGNVFPPELGLPGMVAPGNITPDRETGIGSWTDGEKIRAIREVSAATALRCFP
jgi:hypothetical protein